jgi:hypothetical protein
MARECDWLENPAGLFRIAGRMPAQATVKPETIPASSHELKAWIK